MIRRLLPALVLAFSLTTVFAQEEPAAPDESAVAEPSKTLQASDTEALRAAKDETVRVEGRIQRVGATSGGGIHFLNMSPERDGFVAVVFNSNMDKFPEGLDSYKGKTVQVTGKIEIFRESVPEIVVKTPDQIKVIETEEGAGEESTSDSGGDAKQ